MYFFYLKSKVFSNTLLLGLQYEPETEKLSLKIIEAALAPTSLKANQGTRHLCAEMCPY